MDFRGKIEELIKQPKERRVVFLKTTKGDFAGRVEEFDTKDVNSIALTPVDVLQFSGGSYAIGIPIETIIEVSVITKGKITKSFKK